MNRGNFKCESCARYQSHPVWGHKNCSAHRECAGQFHWEPWHCLDCNIQRDILEYMSNQGIQGSFVSMNKLLERTQQWKATKTAVRDWYFSQIIQEFMIGYETYFTPIALTPEDNRNEDRNENRNDGDGNSPTRSGGARTPCSVTKYFRSDSYRSVSNESDRNISRNSVRSALNEQTRECIDHNMRNDLMQQAESGPGQLYGTNDVPRFQLVQNGEGVRHDDSLPNDTHYSPNSRQPQSDNQIWRLGRSVAHKRSRSYSVDGAIDPNMAQSPDHNVLSRPYYDASIQNAHFQSNETFSHNVAHAPPQQNVGDNKVFLQGQFYIDQSDNQPWFIFDNNIHKKVGVNKIMMKQGNNVIPFDVIYNPVNVSEFRTKPQSTSALSPYMGGSEAHTLMLCAFGARPSEGMSNNKATRTMDMSISPSTGLSRTLDLIKQREGEMLDALTAKQKDKLLATFPGDAFNPVTLVNFTQGWSLCESDFVEWACDKPLSIEQFKNQINLIGNDIRVPPEFIKNEQDSRRILVSHLASMHLIETYGNRVGEVTQTEYKTVLPSECQAVARTLLPVLKHLTVPYLQAKMELRMSVLKGFENNFEAVCLLKTSPWEPNLFPKAAIANLKIKRLNNIPQLLGLHKPNISGAQNNRLPPHKQGFLRYANKSHFHNKNKRNHVPIQSFQDRRQQFNNRGQQNGGHRRTGNKQNRQPPKKPYYDKPNNKPNNQSNNQSNKRGQNRPNTTSKGNNNQTQER